MKIVVIGGHGRVGSKIVEQLGAHGHDAVAADLNTGVNTITGEGLAEAFAGADVVIDVSNSPSFEDAAVMEFFTTSTTNVLAAEQVAGIRHHVIFSIVGADRLPGSGYLRAKVAQEKLIADSPVPYSIIRSTQFYEFVDSIADAATEGDTVRVPDARIQPIAADDAARAVGRIAVGTPVNGVVEIGGPEALGFDELIRIGLSAHDDPRTVVVDPDAQYFGTKLEDTSLLPGDGAQLAETRYRDWLSALATTA
jgi:uncharacterized protein YbjT (DUF2867 family)